MTRWSALGIVVALGLACGGVDLAGAPEEAPGPDGAAPEPAYAPVPPERPVFPLTVGDRYSWQVTRHTGAGLRVLFMATEPARDDVIATWELTVDRALPDARFAASLTRTATGAMPAKTELTLWTQPDGALWMLGPKGPELALELAVPPDPVATERVPCVAHFLDHLPGTCSPAPGGPLSVPPGPVSVVVSAEPDRGRGLAQVLVGIATAGILIPGNKAATEIAELTAYVTTRPATPSPAVERFRGAPTPRTLEKVAPADREDAAAFVALAAPTDRAEVARRSVGALPAADRPSILRVLLSTEPDPTAHLALVARLAPELGGPPTPARRDALVALLPEGDREAGAALLRGEWPVLRAALTHPDDPAAAVRAAAAAAPPSRAEALETLRRTPSPRPVLDALLPGLSHTDQLDLLTAACAAQSFDSERQALLEGRGALLHANETELDALSALLDTFAFDDGRAAAATTLLAAVSEPRRPAILRAAVVGMDWDDGRVALLRAEPTVAKALSAADRKAILAAASDDAAVKAALP